MSLSLYITFVILFYFFKHGKSKKNNFLGPLIKSFYYNIYLRYKYLSFTHRYTWFSPIPKDRDYQNKQTHKQQETQQSHNQLKCREQESVRCSVPADTSTAKFNTYGSGITVEDRVEASKSQQNMFVKIRL